MSRYNHYSGEGLRRMKAQDPEIARCFDGYGHIETEYFGSVWDLTETLGERDVSDYGSASRRNASLCPGYSAEYHDTGWYGFSDAEDLQKQIRTGLDRKKTADMNRRIQNVLQNSVKKRGPVRYLPAGGSVNVPRHLIGIPAMRSRSTKMMPSKVVNLCIDGATLGSVSATQITKAGEYLMEMVQMLQRDGYRIGLYFADTTRNQEVERGNRLRCMVVRIKAPEAAMDISTVGWWLTSPAAQRGASFSWVSSAPDNARIEMPEGIGGVPTQAQSAQLMELAAPGCIPVSLCSLVWMIDSEKTPEQCRDWLEALISDA